MRNGWNMNREVLVYDHALADWRELDDFEQRYTFTAEYDTEERLVLRQYGTVVQSWAIWTDLPGFKGALTPRFRENLAVTQGIVLGEDEPSWSDWLDYATALTFDDSQDRLPPCQTHSRAGRRHEKG